MKIFILSIIFLSPFLTQADVSYQSLAPIDGYVQSDAKIDNNSLSTYLNDMFRLGIALCTGLAVLMIIIGGIQYASSDAWSKKTDGKERIYAALFGLVIALGSRVLLNTINPALVRTELSLEKVTLAEIKTEYDKVYAQWNEVDDAAIEDPSNTAYPAAVAKWNNMQSQKAALDAKYGPQVDPAKANVGPANQKVLAEINKGTSCSSSAHCYAGAVALGDKAGVKFNSVYQSNAYVVGGSPLPKSFGSARDPVPGEMVDYRFFTKKPDGTEQRKDPFHTVVVYSNNGNGNYTVWDWKNSTVTGLRNVNLNFNQADAKGYVGRIYVPQ